MISATALMTGVNASKIGINPCSNSVKGGNKLSINDIIGSNSEFITSRSGGRSVCRMPVSGTIIADTSSIRTGNMVSISCINGSSNALNSSTIGGKMALTNDSKYGNTAEISSSNIGSTSSITGASAETTSPIALTIGPSEF